MKVIHEDKYESKDSYGNASWHQKLDDVRTTFYNYNHIDISNEDGMKAIMSSESLRDQYNDMVAGLVTDDEEKRDIIRTVASNTMRDLRKNTPIRSGEGADAAANNSNYSSLARLNSWIIVGYTARAKALELYHTISSDDPTVSFKYNVDYIVHGSDQKKYFRPRADRDGDLAQFYSMPNILPSSDSAFLANPENAHLELQNNWEGYNGSKVWIKIAGGVTGNLFADSNNQFSPKDYTLEKNPFICGIHYTIPSAANPSTPAATGTMAVWFDREEGTGEQQIKHFYDSISIPYTDAGVSKTADGRVFGEIDLDSGDYSFSPAGVVDYIQLDVKVTNVANQYGTTRAGSKQIIESFSVDNHPYATVPVIPEVSDDFNIGGEGVSAVAYWTDKVTSALANMRDVTMEDELDKAYAKPVDKFKLYYMLGGWKGQMNFPVTARLPGGGDPYSWMKTGIKASLINHLINAEMDGLFEDATPRQWYILGHETDTNLIPDITYSNWDGEGGVGGANEKYGFTINGRAGVADSEGRKIRIIGSVYPRHYRKRLPNGTWGDRLPMRVVLKSMSLEQPTTVYLPYSFRCYSGIMPEYDHRTGLIIAARDCIKNLTSFQSRVTLIGNSDNLYRDIVANNQMPAVSWPNENATTMTITARN